jgi:hypothetical protein
MPNKQEYLTRQEIRRKMKISKKTTEKAQVPGKVGIPA